MTTDATTIENTAGEHDSHTRVRPSYDDINVPVILLIGVISAIITLLIITNLLIIILGLHTIQCF